MSAYLQAIEYWFPDQCVTNEELSSAHPEWSADKIARKTGIQRRYWAADGETASDLAVKAAGKLFDRGVDRSCIDFVVLCTQSPDYFLPTTACMLQQRLGLREDIGAFDYNLGCSGYVYGLGIAKGLIAGGQARNVLLLTAETYSKYMSPDDKSCKTIFGDAATASLVTSERMEGMLNAGILAISYKTFGAGYESLIVPNGASRHPGKDSTRTDYLFMDGKAIFDFSATAVPDSIRGNVALNGFSMDDMDYFVVHQANLYMMNIIRARCQIPAEKFIIDIEDGGNTVSSSIPVAMARRCQGNPPAPGSKMSLCGFGVGLSIASTVLSSE